MTAQPAKLDEVNFGEFLSDQVDKNLLEIVKTISLLECNATNYAAYLCKVFPDDEVMNSFLKTWGHEEFEHGTALGRWIELADASYNFQDAVTRFNAVFKCPEISDTKSIRQSPIGELLAQSIVETGTSTLYDAIAKSSQEPLLRNLCKIIADDEFRHYRLFCEQIERYGDRDKIGPVNRLKIAFERILEIRNDELGCAYHTANLYDRPYDPRLAIRAYEKRAFPLYHRQHIALGIDMTANACGFRDNRRWLKCLCPIVWLAITTRARYLEPIAD